MPVDDDRRGNGIENQLTLAVPDLSQHLELAAQGHAETRRWRQVDRISVEQHHALVVVNQIQHRHLAILIEVQRGQFRIGEITALENGVDQILLSAPSGQGLHRRQQKHCRQERTLKARRSSGDSLVIHCINTPQHSSVSAPDTSGQAKRARQRKESRRPVRESLAGGQRKQRATLSDRSL